MVSSTVYLMSSCYSVFLLMLFYVLYDEMAISSLYGIHQVHLITYVWFSLVCLGKFQNKRRCEQSMCVVCKIVQKSLIVYTIILVTIVEILFIRSFFFYSLLWNHTFPTNPNKISLTFFLYTLYSTLQGVVIVTDYMTTKITESNNPYRNRMKYLTRLAPNGYLWQRDLFTSELDLRIEDSLRSLDTLNFTMQYYYGKKKQKIYFSNFFQFFNF